MNEGPCSTFPFILTILVILPILVFFNVAVEMDGMEARTNMSLRYIIFSINCFVNLVFVVDRSKVDDWILFFEFLCITATGTLYLKLALL